MPSLDLGAADAAVLIDYIDEQSRARARRRRAPGRIGGRRADAGAT